MKKPKQIIFIELNTLTNDDKNKIVRDATLIINQINPEKPDNKIGIVNYHITAALFNYLITITNLSK